MENSNVKTKFSVKQMTIVGMLSAISIFLGLTGLGFIPLPGMKATIMHIPVIIGAIVEGPVVGALVGLVFGLFSMYQAFTVPAPTAFVFWNPIVAVLPRILIGIVSYYVYVFVKSLIKKKSAAIACAALLGTLTNTAGVLGFSYIIYAAKYATALGLSASQGGYAIFMIGVTNGIPEAIVSVIISIPVVLTILKMRNK